MSVKASLREVAKKLESTIDGIVRDEVHAKSSEISNRADEPGVDEFEDSTDSGNEAAEFRDVVKRISFREQYPIVPEADLAILERFAMSELPVLVTPIAEACEDLDSEYRITRERSHLIRDERAANRASRQKQTKSRDDLQKIRRKEKKQAFGYRVKAILWMVLCGVVSFGDSALISASLISHSIDAGVGVTISSWAIGFAAMIILGAGMEFAVLRPYSRHEANEEVTTADIVLCIVAWIVEVTVSLSLSRIRIEMLKTSSPTDFALFVVSAIVISGIAFAGALCMRIALANESSRSTIVQSLQVTQDNLDRLISDEAEQQRIDTEAKQLNSKLRDLVRQREKVLNDGVRSILNLPHVRRMIEAASHNISTAEAEFNVNSDFGSRGANPLSNVGRNGRGPEPPRQ